MRARLNALRVAALMLPAILIAAATAARAAPPAQPAGAPVADRCAQPLLPWPAPVGHRQPRAADVATAPPKSESDLRLERLHRALAETTPICRGC
jgi:hypothetical protein